MRINQLTLAILFCLFCFGCSQNAHKETPPATSVTRKVEGNAFIVANDGSTYNLSLLEVNFIKESDLQPLVQTNGQTIRSNIQYAWEYLTNYPNKIAKMQVELRLRGDGIQPDTLTQEQMETEIWRKRVLNSIDKEKARKAHDGKAIKSAFFNEIEHMGEPIDTNIFVHLPKPAFTVKTDGHGRFGIEFH
jgi:hypothetical protein